MASGSAILALKAALVVAAVLAMLVLPSSGQRASSLGPRLAAARAPSRAPVRRCKDCGSYCISLCRVSVPPKCSKYCDIPSCEDCMSSEIKKCKVRCTGTGSCDCDGKAARSCQNSCSGSSSCADCSRQSGKQCAADCNSKCAATCG